MALHWYSVVVDCHDPAAQARWWAETLGYDIVFEADDEVCLAPGWASEAPVEEEASWHREPQGLVFVPVPEGRTSRTASTSTSRRTAARIVTPRSPS